MDLMTLSRHSGITPRLLRYAIYHTLSPNVRAVHIGKGSVRSFTSFEAFGIALSALLLQVGFKRDLVAAAMKLLVTGHGPKVPISRIPLFIAFSSRHAVQLEIGDGKYVRMRTKPGCDDDLEFDHTDWTTLNGVRLDLCANYTPLVLVRVNLATLRDSLRAAGE